MKICRSQWAQICTSLNSLSPGEQLQYISYAPRNNVVMFSKWLVSVRVEIHHKKLILDSKT